MNEEIPAASPADASAGAPAPANPSATPQPTSSPSTSSAVSTRSVSRFYSRMGRGGPAAPKAADSTPPLSTEGLTAEQAVAFKDNLPVRATMGDRAEYAPEQGSDFSERRPERDDRGRDRDRGERGDRGRGRDRDRGERRDRDQRSFDRPPGKNVEASARSSEAVPPVASEAPSQTAPESSVPEAPTPAPVVAAKPVPPPEAPRRVRFEDANQNESRSSVQEFRPSRDRSYADEAGRARREIDARKEEQKPAPKSGGIFGWMKSMLSSKPDESPAPERSDDRPRGDRPSGQQPRGQRPPGGQGGQRREQGGVYRPQGQGQHGGPGGEGQGGEHGGRRRRRRRGGRNRGGPGGGQEEQGHRGGGDI